MARGMRIIGGTAAGATIRAPKGLSVRPTPDRVRLAVFNSLGNRVTGSRVLDLFAGTGALSLECLSRGAESATIVELSARHARVLKDNARVVNLSQNRINLQVRDAFTALSRLVETRERFDLILADPPYGEKNVGRRSDSLAQKLLDDKNLPNLLESDGLFILGHTKRDTLEFTGSWDLVNTLKHGDTVMRFLRGRKVI